MALNKNHRRSVGAVMLRDWMRREDKSQAVVAKLVGVSQGAVSKWLRGAEPRFSLMRKLKDLANIPVESWAVKVDDVTEAA